MRAAGRAAELMAVKVKGLRALCISLSRSPLHLADAAAADAAALPRQRHGATT